MRCTAKTRAGKRCRRDIGPSGSFMVPQQQAEIVAARNGAPPPPINYITAAR